MTLTPSDIAELETMRWGSDPSAAYRRKEIALRVFGGMRPIDTPIVAYLYQVELADLHMLRRQLAEGWGFGSMPRAAAEARVRALEAKFAHPLLRRLFGAQTPLP